MASKKKTTKDQRDAPTPTPRVGPLRTIADVQVELARVYRQARLRKIDLDEAKGFGYLLQLLATITRDATVEARVAALEERLNAAEPNSQA